MPVEETFSRLVRENPRIGAAPLSRAESEVTLKAGNDTDQGSRKVPIRGCQKPAAAKRAEGGPAAYARVSLRESGSIPGSIPSGVSTGAYRFDTTADAGGGETTVLDSVSLPVNFTSGTISALGCLENPDRIQPGSSASGPTCASLVFRTLRQSPQPELLEIDACLGVWKAKLPLPSQITGAVDLFSGSAFDYALRMDTRQAWALDSSTAHFLGNFSIDLAEADFQGGRFYVNYHGDSLRIFPDQAVWFDNHPVSGISIPRVNPQKFSVGDSSVFFLAQSDSTRIYRWDNSSGSHRPPITLVGFSRTCVGMAAGMGQELWLLSDGNDLYRYEGVTGVLLSKTHIEISDSLRGLAGPYR